MSTPLLRPCPAHVRSRIGATCLSARRCSAKVHCQHTPALPVTSLGGMSSHGMTSSSSSSATEYPVEVRVYDIDRYGMKKLAPTILKKKLDAIWHTGIAVYGSEYWFDHRINCESLGDVEYAFGFGPAYVFNLGTTKVPREQFESWLQTVMAERYSLEHYDFERRNCHHFSDELALYLTGNHIPEWCVKHGEDALSELDKSDVEKIRWASNKVARIMMVTWGRYNKARFVKKKKQDQGGKIRASEMPA